MVMEERRSRIKKMKIMIKKNRTAYNELAVSATVFVRRTMKTVTQIVL